MDKPGAHKTSSNFNIGLKPMLDSNRKHLKRLNRYNRRVIKSGVQVLQSNVGPSVTPRKDQTFDSNSSSVPTSSF